MRLTDDRELRRLAFLELVRKPGRGRKQGQRSKRDLDDVTKAVLQDALDEISDIKRIVTSVPEWKGRWKGCAAIATEIALERASGGNAKLQAKLAKQLETFKSNLSRARKRRRRS